MWPFSARAETRADPAENPQIPLSDVKVWRSLLDEWHGASGAAVTEKTALEVPAVWCAVNFIAGTLASLPLQLFVKTDKGREAADRDPLYGILHDAPNEEWTSFAWRKYSMVNTLLHGRSLTFIERNKAGRVMNLWPLDPTKCTIERAGGRKRYTYTDGNRTVVYGATEIIDIPFMLEADGLAHVRPVEKLKGAVGLSLALERYAQKFFDNGGVPPLALYGPVGSPAAASRASTDVTQAIRDANAERRNVLIMPTGHELKPIGIDPQKSQMEEARRFQIEEIARVFDIPPVFLQDLTHGTFSNTEQQDLHFVKHTLRQWLKAWEDEMNLKLLSARNRTKYVEFNLDGLLRGDFKSRMEGLAKGVQNAIITPNEARSFENYPNGGPDGDKLWLQGATLPIDILARGNPEPAAPAPAANDDNADEADAA